MAMEFWVDNANGSDNNSGSSEDHSPLVNGTSGSWNSTSTVQLDSGSDLSGVTANEDTIRLNGQTAGRYGTDIFLITAVNDGLDQVTVSPTPGTGSGVWAIGGAFATLQRAMDVITDAETCYVQSGTDYTDDGSGSSQYIFRMERAASSGPNYIAFIGYTTTKTDGGMVTLDGTGFQSCLTDNSLTWTYYIFRNFHMKNSSAEPANLNGVNACQFHNCWFSGSTANHGIELGAWCLLYKCKFYNNSNTGLWAGNSTFLLFCEVYGNSAKGIQSNGGWLIGNVCDGEGGTNHAWETGNNAKLMMNNTVIAPRTASDHGIQSFESAGNLIAIINNIVEGGDYCLNNTTDRRDYEVVINNILYNPLTGATNNVNATGTITTDPQFVNKAGEDFRLKATSPARAAGVDLNEMLYGTKVNDIGAHQRQEMPGRVIESGAVVRGA